MSRNTICVVVVVRTPRICVRVVCGRSETIDTLRPTSWFTSVDFPTFGRPTSETNPDRNAVGVGRRAAAHAGRCGSVGRSCGVERGGSAPTRCAGPATRSAQNSSPSNAHALALDRARGRAG